MHQNDQNSVAPISTFEEKPQNGIAGLKHWRSDILAGLMVSLVSLPFSLAIAISSGAPPVAGLISAIIAGLIYPFLGGSYVTISGPAAGLAPVLFVAMTTLGAGDREAGYPLLLGVICMVGVVQIILSRLHVARFSAWFSPTVVEAMLASIGLLIIAKELPDLLGRKFEAHDFWPILAELPQRLMEMNGSVFAIGAVCLGLTILLSSSKSRWAKIVPPPLVVVVVGLGLALAFQIEGVFLIEIPDNLKDGMRLPNFQGLFADRSLWLTVLGTVVTLTLIDGVESLATIAGIDKIDPYKRRSSPDRTLMAMGVSNVLSSVAGGLTIIPGGVKSTTCIVTGGKTLWANFYNAVFLLLYLFLGKGLINMIPRSALAAIVVYIGYKLCQPKIWRHVASIGSEQLLVFAVTVLVTVSTDLLLGIFTGMALDFVLNLSFAWPAARSGQLAPAMAGGRGMLSPIAHLFRSPVANRELADDVYHIHFSGPLVAFNSLQVNRELARIPLQATTVRFHVGEQVTLIDHTASACLMGFAHDYQQSGKGRVVFDGLDNMFKCSGNAACVRLGGIDLAGPAHGGLSALALKIWNAITTPHPRINRESRLGKPSGVPTRESPAPASDDLAFVSLSTTGQTNGPAQYDVSRLGPAPTADAREEIEKLSLTACNSKPETGALMLNNPSQLNSSWLLHPARIPVSLLAKIGVGGVIAAAFLQAANNPHQGLYALGFWVLLFVAAATKARSDV
jgi:MFS superfamily sulfate permease-like transporter